MTDLTFLQELVRPHLERRVDSLQKVVVWTKRKPSYEEVMWEDKRTGTWAVTGEEGLQHFPNEEEALRAWLGLDGRPPRLPSDINLNDTLRELA